MMMRLVWVIMLAVVGHGWAAELSRELPPQSVKVCLPGKEKKEFKFHYRVPKCYEPEGRQVHRVLINCVWATQEFDAWADERGVFVFHAIFTNRLCWKVENGFGRAIVLGLEELKKSYRVAPDQLLVYGISRGGQLSNYFVTWKPEIVTAWVAGIPGILDQPHKRMAYAPGLVTAGEADSGRYHMMLGFLSDARKYELPIIWRSYANTAHEATAESSVLIKAFLSYHHERTKHLLQKSDNNAARARRCLSDLCKTKLAPPPPVCIGDAQEWKCYDLDSDEAKELLPQFRVELPSQEIAMRWSGPAALADTSPDN